MPLHSRRQVLAMAGGALLAGCASSGDGNGATTTGQPSPTEPPSNATEPRHTDGTPEPVDGPAPLGYEAVPPGSDDPASFERSRTYPAWTGYSVAAATRQPDGLSALLYPRQPDTDAPVLLHTDPKGQETGHLTLDSLPTNRAYFLERLDDVTVVGGVDPGEELWTWFRGYRDGEVVFDYVRDHQTTYADVTAVDGELVAVGTTGWGSDADGHFDGIVTRLGSDGSVQRELTVGDRTTDTRFWSVTPTADGLLAGGSRDNEIWVVGFDAAGAVRWQRTIPREGAYSVNRLAVGESGTYAVAETNQFAMGNNHVMLLSLRDGGGVDWIRVFDPNYEDYGTAPRELHVAGAYDAGGPVLVGHTEREGWLAATDSAGSVRWAGYRRHDGQETKATGSIRVGGQMLVHGEVRPESEQTRGRPWVAWVPLA